MPRTTERLALPGTNPGTTHHVTLHRYGEPGARPKVYLQASLHADETPGLLVLHHLIRLLDVADAEAGIGGEILVVPYANPLGLGQLVNGSQLGRYDLCGGGNFNRNWPDLFTPVADRVKDCLTDDPAANLALIRDAMGEALAGLEPRRSLDGLRHLLAGLAYDADVVLDLHCDDEALMHLFLISAHWPLAADLAGELGCRAVLLADESGGAPFDEAFSTPWTRLADRFPERPIPPACLSATVELRGRPDVSDALAERDAAALLRFLRRRGFVAGDPDPLPAPLCEATRLDAVDTVRAPASGVLSYVAALGERVGQGEVIAHLIDPAAADPLAARRPITSATDGLVLSRRVHKFVSAGMTVAKVVGKQPLPRRQGGSLLED